MDWEHQVSSPGLACRSWHYSIQSSAAVPGGKVVVVHGLYDGWGKTAPSRAALRGLASGCPTVPQNGLFLQKCKGQGFNTAAREYRINVRKSTELGKNNPKKKKPQHWVRPSHTAHGDWRPDNRCDPTAVNSTRFVPSLALRPGH